MPHQRAAVSPPAVFLVSAFSFALLETSEPRSFSPPAPLLSSSSNKTGASALLMCHSTGQHTKTRYRAHVSRCNMMGTSKEEVFKRNALSTRETASSTLISEHKLTTDAVKSVYFLLVAGLMSKCFSTFLRFASRPTRLLILSLPRRAEFGLRTILARFSRIRSVSTSSSSLFTALRWTGVITHHETLPRKVGTAQPCRQLPPQDALLPPLSP